MLGLMPRVVARGAWPAGQRCPPVADRSIAMRWKARPETTLCCIAEDDCRRGGIKGSRLTLRPNDCPLCWNAGRSRTHRKLAAVRPFDVTTSDRNATHGMRHLVTTCTGRNLSLFVASKPFHVGLDHDSDWKSAPSSIERPSARLRNLPSSKVQISLPWRAFVPSVPKTCSYRRS